MSFATDAQRFVNGRQDAGSFVTHVRGVDAADLEASAARRLTLPTSHKGAGAYSSEVETPTAPSRIAWLPSLSFARAGRDRGLHVVIAEHHAPDARCAYVTGNVDADALLFEA